MRSGDSPEALKEHLGTKLKEHGVAEDDVRRLLPIVEFVKADIADAASLAGLAERLDDPNRVRAFYLATPPDRFIPASRR